MPRSNMSLIWLLTLLKTLNCISLWSLTATSRHSIVTRLQISCCSRGHEAEWSSCGCTLVCFWRHCPVFIISQNRKVWVEHCLSRVLTHYSGRKTQSSSSEFALAAGPCELAVGPGCRGSTGETVWEVDEVPGSFWGSSLSASESIGRWWGIHNCGILIWNYNKLLDNHGLN